MAPYFSIMLSACVYKSKLFHCKLIGAKMTKVPKIIIFNNIFYNFSYRIIYISFKIIPIPNLRPIP